MNLPVGTDFDFIIKQKAEEIDNQKLQNNYKMDELVDALGYMDYRDALACNKYIIEAKQSGDYHQVARARILEIAFARMDSDKRKEIQKKARQDSKATGAAQNELELRAILNEDSEMAQLYQEAFHAEKTV